MPEIFVSNTLTGKKEKFESLKNGHVGIYACGVTTYDHFHIGHALQAVFFDMICRYLRFAGYRVTYVRNYTDVDDKIIARAATQGISPAVLAQQMIDSSDEDMVALGCELPSFRPRVSQCIPEIIGMVEELVSKGAAYATSRGDVYYRVRRKEDYGKLSNRKVDELRSGTRDIKESDKEDELDFALWKADTTPDASWGSPWGRGRPGWHIECSAMSRLHLGKTFDIHGGGRDLVFPHHENEIAQSESANGCLYSRYWIHSGLLTIEKQKMSKSLGNHINLKDFLKKWPAESLRLAYLQYHYASNIDFQRDTFLRAHQRLCYYYQSLDALDSIAAEGPKLSLDTAAIREEFHRNMSDDFNSGMALASLNKEFKRANEMATAKKNPLNAANAHALAKILRECFAVFGLLQAPPKTMLETLRTMILPELGIRREEIEAKIGERKQARIDKDFAKADQVRAELSQRGIELMDTPSGTDWRIKYEA